MIPSFMSLSIHSCLFSLSHKRERNINNWDICETNQSILRSNTYFGYNHGEQSKHEPVWQTATYWSKIMSERLHLSIVWMMLKSWWNTTLANLRRISSYWKSTLHYITHCHQRVIPSLPLQQYISCLPGSIFWPTNQRRFAPQRRTWIERTEPNACHTVIS